MKGTRRLLVLACTLALTGITGGLSGATYAHAAGLPPGARILRQVALPARRNAFVAIYVDPMARVGVLRGEPSHRRLLWSHPLPAGRATLAAPGPHGVFLVLVEAPLSHAVHLFAYRLRRGAVTSVISGHRSGEITASEGVSVQGEGFVTRTKDTQHVGSVAYRWVTHYDWTGGLFQAANMVQVPDYSRADYPLPNATVHTAQGNVILLRLEIADTEQQRETGLMYRSSLDPDAGMIFVWPQETHDSFWMENTYIPLSIAFLSAGGQIQELQDMAPLTTSQHLPVLPYRYAIEVNQGFFEQWGIDVGTTVHLHLDIRHPVPLA